MTPVSALSFEDNWKLLCSLQPIYSALVREFVVEVPAGPALEPGEPSQEAAAQTLAWFQQLDTQIQVHQLRQFLQTTTLASEAVLRDLLAYHLHKQTRMPSDRDKID